MGRALLAIQVAPPIRKYDESLRLISEFGRRVAANYVQSTAKEANRSRFRRAGVSPEDSMLVREARSGQGSIKDRSCGWGAKR